MGMKNLMGQDNYLCLMSDKTEVSCEHGRLSRCTYAGTAQCPYSQAEMRMTTANLGMTNYSKWMMPRAMSSPFTHFSQLIMDEGHSIPGLLANAMRIKLYRKEIEETLQLDFPTVKIGKDWEPEVNFNNMQLFRVWARGAKSEAEAEMKEAKYEMDRVRNPSATVIKHYLHMRELTRRLGILQIASPHNWVVDEVEKGYTFDPIRPGRYAEGMLFQGVKRIIIMSATLREKTLKLLGLQKDQYHFQEFDSDFDPSDSPITYVPTIRVDNRQTDLSFLWRRFDQFIMPRRDMKGLINTVSYARRDEVLANSRFAEWMMVNEKGEPPTEMVEEFKRSSPGHILVSPSVGTGYDFPGTELEWIIMSKIPFEPPSKIVKARDADDKGQYRGYRAAQTMDQTFGRGTRFPRSKPPIADGDRCDSIIFDDHMQWFMAKFGKYFSRSFHKRYRRSDTMPQPLPKMVESVTVTS